MYIIVDKWKWYPKKKNHWIFKKCKSCTTEKKYTALNFTCYSTHNEQQNPDSHLYIFNQEKNIQQEVIKISSPVSKFSVFSHEGSSPVTSGLRCAAFCSSARWNTVRLLIRRETHQAPLWGGCNQCAPEGRGKTAETWVAAFLPFSPPERKETTTEQLVWRLKDQTLRRWRYKSSASTPQYRSTAWH